jgi:hypothetical protein
LIRLWLKAPVEERDDNGKRRMSGDKSNTRGTPQGGVVSPLLANIYMNRFLKHWRLSGRGEAHRAHVVSYADDFVILSRGHATEALIWTRTAMAKLELTLNEAKTSVKDARRQGFDFLGYTLGPRHLAKGGRWYLGASPSKKSVLRIKTKVRVLLRPGNMGPWPNVRKGLSTGFSPVGPRISVMAPALRLTKPSTAKSTIASDASCADGTRSKDVARTDFRGSRCSANSKCCVFNACAARQRRGPCDEISRKAGCGKSARPV